MAVVESVQRAKIPVVDQQAGGGVGGDIVLDLRKGYRGGEVLFAARVAGQQHADLTHADAVTRRPAGAGIIAGELPVFCAKEKPCRGAASRGVEQRPSQAAQKNARISIPVSNQ